MIETNRLIIGSAVACLLRGAAKDANGCFPVSRHMLVDAIDGKGVQLSYTDETSNTTTIPALSDDLVGVLISIEDLTKNGFKYDKKSRFYELRKNGKIFRYLFKTASLVVITGPGHTITFRDVVYVHDVQFYLNAFKIEFKHEIL